MDETVKRLGEELADAVRRAEASEARVFFAARPDRSAVGRTADPDAPPFTVAPALDPLALTDQDRRFLRSLRIAADTRPGARS